MDKNMNFNHSEKQILNKWESSENLTIRMTLQFPFGTLLFTGFWATQAEFETSNWSHGF